MAVKITPEYTDLLNQAVEREIQVSIQYFLQHAKMEKLKKREISQKTFCLTKQFMTAVGKILHEIAIEEMKHAAAIMERIYYLGGEATTKSKQPIIGNSISEFAKLGVKAEEEALTLVPQNNRNRRTNGRLGNTGTLRKNLWRRRRSPFQIPRIHRFPRRKR